MNHPRLALLLLLPATACLVHGRHGRVAVIAPLPVVSIRYIDREPPPPRFERAPPAPAVDMVWVAGYWSWDGRAYLWVPGAYRNRPHRGAAWVDGRWDRHDRGWYWREGHWR